MEPSYAEIQSYVATVVKYLSVMGIGSVAAFLLKWLLGRKKESADIRKTEAEAAKANAEAEHLKVSTVEKWATTFDLIAEGAPKWAKTLQDAEKAKQSLASDLNEAQSKLSTIKDHCAVIAENAPHVISVLYGDVKDDERLTHSRVEKIRVAAAKITEILQ